jgi:hypothetical protein
VEVGVADLNAFGVVAVVKAGVDGQARLGRGRGDQVDDDSVTDQRLAAPVDADEAKWAVFDLG